MFFKTGAWLNFKASMRSSAQLSYLLGSPKKCVSIGLTFPYLEEVPKAPVPAPLLTVEETVGITPYHLPFVGKGMSAFTLFSLYLMHSQYLPHGAGMACWDGDNCPSFNPVLILLRGGRVAKGLWESGTSFGPSLLLGMIPTSQR